MSPSNSTNDYQELRRKWKLAYPSRSKQQCDEDAQQWWKSNKHNAMAVAEKLRVLQLMTKAKAKPIILSFAKKLKPAVHGAYQVASQYPDSTASQNYNTNNEINQSADNNEEDHNVPDGKIDVNPVPGPSKNNEQDIRSETIMIEEHETPKVVRRKAPAQEKQKLEIERLEKNELRLLKAKQLGLILSIDQIKELKELKKQIPEAKRKLKRLKQTQRASKKFRKDNKSKIQKLTAKLDDSDPLKTLGSGNVGRPNLETQQPGLLSTILNIVSLQGSADDRRRCDTLRTVKSLDELLYEMKNAGFNISRSGLYLRLIPRNMTSREGKLHVTTVPVKLARAQNTFRKAHEDSHFAAATVKHLKNVAVIFGENNVCVISQDDKARVPLGLPAAQKQSPILMRLDYRVTLPDHDWVIATKHKLIPSVYAGLEIKNGRVTYSGPTYIAIRSGKHDSSTAYSHALDVDKLLHMPHFLKMTTREDRSIKPILIFLTDGGPDENPRFPKTLNYAAVHFKKHNLDGIFVATHAPHQSASNPVERRMAPLSRDLCGLILPYDEYGNHLGNGGKTIDTDLEKKNFRKAGQILSDVWSQRIIDSHEVVAEYVDPVEPGSDSTSADSSSTDYDYNLDKIPDFLTEKWKIEHVRQSQYLLQIVKCGNPFCCEPTKTNIREFLQSQFLPPPILFTSTLTGITKVKPTEQGHFMDLSTRLSLQFLQNDPYMAYDFYCPSLQTKLHARTCKLCNLYSPSISANTKHGTVHSISNNAVLAITDDQDECNMEVEEYIENVLDDADAYIIHDLNHWLQPVFEDEEAGVSTSGVNTLPNDS